MWSARPKIFEVRGHIYKDWEGHIADSDTYVAYLNRKQKKMMRGWRQIDNL